MSKVYRACIIGLGKIARAHMYGYLSAENVGRIEVVAGADPVEEARTAFAREYGIERVYSDYKELLEKEKPEIVSICTWPPLHPEMTEVAFSLGVKGVLCEKPMAVDLEGADRMLCAARKANGVLVIGHQRLFESKFVRCHELIMEGAIGELVQISAICAGDLLTDGTHSVDMLRFLNDYVPAVWVIGNIDLRDRGPVNTGPESFGFQEWDTTHMRYGHPVETGAFGVISFSNGVRCMLETGICARPGYQRFLVYGTEGFIDVSGDFPIAGQPPLRARIKGQSEWFIPELEKVNAFSQEISLMLDSIETGSIHPLNGESARATQEILMAIFESARQRARIDLPLKIKEHPLLSMLTQ